MESQTCASDTDPYETDVLVRWNNGTESRVSSKDLTSLSECKPRLEVARKVKMRSKEGFMFGKIVYIYPKDVLVRWYDGVENIVSSKDLVPNKIKKWNKKKMQHVVKLVVGEKVRLNMKRTMLGTILDVYNYKNTNSKYHRELITTNLISEKCIKTDKCGGREMNVVTEEPGNDQSVDCLDVSLPALPQSNNNKRDEDCLENASYCKFGTDHKDQRDVLVRFNNSVENVISSKYLTRTRTRNRIDQSRLKLKVGEEKRHYNNKRDKDCLKNTPYCKFGKDRKDQIDVLVRWNNGMESTVSSKDLEPTTTRSGPKVRLEVGRRVKMRSEEGYIFGNILFVYDQVDVLVRWNNGTESIISSKDLTRRRSKYSRSQKAKLEIGEKVHQLNNRFRNGTILYVYNYKNTSGTYSQELNTINLTDKNCIKTDKCGGREVSGVVVDPDNDQSIDCTDVRLSALPEFNNNKRDEDCSENTSDDKFGKDHKDKKCEEQPPVEQITQVVSERGNEIEIFDCNSVADYAESVSIKDEEIYVDKQDLSNESYLNIVSELFSLKEGFDDFEKYHKGVKRKACEEGCETVSEQLIVKNTTSQNESTSLASDVQIVSHKPAKKQEFEYTKIGQEVTNSNERSVKPCSVFIESNMAKSIKLGDNCKVIHENTKELQNGNTYDLKTTPVVEDMSNELYAATFPKIRETCQQKEKTLKSTLCCSTNKELPKNEDHLRSYNVEESFINNPQVFRHVLPRKALVGQTFPNFTKHQIHQVHQNLVEQNRSHPSLSSTNFNTSLESEITKYSKDLAVSDDEFNNQDLKISRKCKPFRTDLDISGSNEICLKSVQKCSHSELQNSFSSEQEKVPLTINHIMKKKDRENINKPYHSRAETLKLKHSESDSMSLDLHEMVKSVMKTTTNLQTLLLKPNVKTPLDSSEVQSVIKTSAALQNLLSKSNALKTEQPDKTNAEKHIFSSGQDNLFLANYTPSGGVQNTICILPIHTDSSREQIIFVPNYTALSGLQNIVLPNYTSSNRVQNILIPNYNKFPVRVQNRCLRNETSSNGLHIDTSLKGLQKATSSSGLQNVISPSGLLNVKSSNGLINPTSASGLINGTYSNGLINPTSASGLLNATSASGLINGTSSNGLINPTSASVLLNATSASGLQKVSAQKNTSSNVLQNYKSSSKLQNNTLTNEIQNRSLQDEISLLHLAQPTENKLESSEMPIKSVEVQLPTDKAKNFKEVYTSSSLEDCLDGAPPFIREVLKCDSIRDGFITSDLRFVLSLLPDIEEMTDDQKIHFQLKLIDILNDVLSDPQLQE